MHKILIADDHILIREGFKKIIDLEPDMRAVGEAKTASEVIEFIMSNSCDAIVLDISLPDRSGLEIIKDIHSINPNIKILILSMHPEEKFAYKAFKSGALGYITKESATSELIKAIRKVLSGRQYVSEEFSEIMINRISNRSEFDFERLSDREFEVLRKIALGKSVSQISEELSISVSTVNTYRSRIMEKLGINSNAGLIHYALKNRLIE